MNVVIVDDNLINLKLTEAMLHKLGGCTPISFASSIRGLEWCEQNDADLIILDYMMPELDGLEFFRRLREHEGKAAIPVLMVTANDNPSVRHEAFWIGILDFINKPLDKTEFVARIKNTLDLRSWQKQVSGEIKPSFDGRGPQRETDQTGAQSRNCSDHGQSLQDSPR